MDTILPLLCSLQQLGDAGVSLIILIAFSLVSAGASNYIVNERVSGEKLQQKLSDVSFKTYWGVNFIWDFTVSYYILQRILQSSSNESRVCCNVGDAYTHLSLHKHDESVSVVSKALDGISSRFVFLIQAIISFRSHQQVYTIALLLGAIVFKMFNLPVFVDKDNLYGVVLLLLLFGFSSTHMVHLCEKLFSEASIANMYILCLNIMLGLCTSMTIILFDVLGESEVMIE